MKTLVTFEVDQKYKKIGNEILGKDSIIWYPDTEEADIFLIRGNDFPPDQHPKFIQAISAGTDHIDLKNIPDGSMIASNAGAYSISVAEHAFAFLLERVKKIGKFRTETSEGIFRPEETTLLFGKTIGIIGYGGIGSRIAALSKSFGMRVIAIGRGYRDSNVEKFYSLDNLDLLLRESDIITISIPLTAKTAGLIGKAELEVVKKNCIIINVARAEIVKRNDILEFLKSNLDVSYLTDVWWEEPDLKDAYYSNVVVTPHIAGGLSGEVMEIAFKNAFQNIKRFVDGEEVRNIVKLEESVYVERRKIGV